jgi:hypothetical protein
MTEINYLSYDDWIAFVFDHPTSGPDWYWGEDASYWNAPASLTVDYVTRLFEKPLPALSAFTDAQLNLSLHYLIGPELGEHMLCLNDPTVSIDVRERCVRSCESLFGQLFGSRCSAHLSDRDEPGSAPLNAVCYMWWDTMPVSGGPNPDDRVVLHRTALDTMAAVLEMNSLACQESALHGLGHWRSGFPGKVEALLLTRSSKLTLTLAPSY